ncbi:MAG: hypothetical protein AMJ41_04410 [candidate division Zixibacteria bacterium DG_27]|nr:MAG: hypothetical protein AMJ41_04410 [candidate division Zixibacteria bacterium DG_27]
MRQEALAVGVVLAFVLALSTPAFSAQRKTGVVKDNFYTDNLLNFEMQALSNWKVKTYKEKPERPKLERVMITKKNYEINPHIVQGSHYTVPTVMIYSDTTSLSLEEYAKLLAESVNSVNSKNKLYQEMKILTETEFYDSTSAQLAGEKAKLFRLKNKFRRAHQSASGGVLQTDGNTRLIEDFNIYEVYLMKRGDRIIVIHFYCEREFYNTNQGEFHDMLNSFKFL